MSTPEGVMTRGYNAAERESRIAYSDGTDLLYQYDETGRLTEGNSLSLRYDAVGRMIESNGIAMTRDPLGRLETVTYAPSKTVRYTFDCTGAIEEISDWLGGVIRFEKDAAGSITAVRRPNSVSTLLSYDGEGILAGLEERRGDEQLSSITWQRGPGGRIVSTERNVPLFPAVAPGSQEFTFDAASQINDYAYDGNGRVVSGGGRTYEWDLADRLLSFTESGVKTTLSYDGLSMLISRTSSESSETYVQNHAFDAPVVAITRQGGQDRTYYVYMPDGSLLYSIDAATGARRFYHFDESGTAIFLTADNGQVTDTYAVGPYGETVIRRGGTTNPFVYHGRAGVMQLTATGLYGMRYRVYDGTSARFLSRDLAYRANPLSVNPYQFARGNPTIYGDPMGLSDSLIIDAGSLYVSYNAFDTATDADSPSDASVYQNGIKFVGKTAQMAIECTGKSFVNQGLNLVQEAAQSNSLDDAIKAGASGAQTGNRMLQSSEILGATMTYAGWAFSTYNEVSLAADQGQDLTSTAFLGANTLGSEVFVSAALASNPVVALADAATGGNISQAVKQTGRIINAYFGDSRDQRAYEANAESTAGSSSRRTTRERS